MKSKTFLALDVNSKKEAFALAEKWAPHVSGFKVGPRLGFLMTPYEWKTLSQKGEVFLDYKFFDIPSTVVSSVKASFNLGASYCTVHALNGGVCLNELAKLEKSLNQIRPFKILCVTLLTSFDQVKNILPLVKGLSPEQTVSRLAKKVLDSGLTGVVSSAAEVKKIKSMSKKFFCVTPGIRFKTDSTDDQKRVSVPAEAWSNGSDYIVMGRSLIRACADEHFFKTTSEELDKQWRSVQ